MEKAARGRPVEKYLYLPVLDLGRLGILGVFYTFHGGPESGACGAVAHIGVTAQADPLLRALEIRHFGSFDPSGFYTTERLTLLRKVFGVSAESIDETKDPIKKRAG
jgi:hypothetical protein